MEEKLKKAGLVDIQKIDPSIQVELKYSSTDNFLKKDVYGSLERGYLVREAALKLAQAQKELRKQKPGYSLLVYDAARPLSVQYKMWEIVKGTDKQIYIGDPERGSIHNYGAAVDITIVDEKGVPLDMGTPMDYFGWLAEPKREQHYLTQGKLTRQQVANRQLLRSAMTKAGFIGISSEWWHFNAFSQDWVRQHLKVIP
ncbi:hypothetical protein DCMF_01545 [Candidatus Formimonas warabiya]|uniref:D-alanyl-D-alanine dipeptidase n=1 Tax=Formimonas warabiya TaxID=1761012 RepID=A0A3G1L0H0_FORW1|nr:hypothetical protein DCMF_01545 [Candidatus Formimonas warabiya]